MPAASCTHRLKTEVLPSGFGAENEFRLRIRPGVTVKGDDPAAAVAASAAGSSDRPATGRRSRPDGQDELQRHGKHRWRVARATRKEDDEAQEQTNEQGERGHSGVLSVGVPGRHTRRGCRWLGNEDKAGRTRPTRAVADRADAPTKRQRSATHSPSQPTPRPPSQTTNTSTGKEDEGKSWDSPRLTGPVTSMDRARRPMGPSQTASPPMSQTTSQSMSYQWTGQCPAPRRPRGPARSSRSDGHHAGREHRYTCHGDHHGWCERGKDGAPGRPGCPRTPDVRPRTLHTSRAEVEQLRLARFVAARRFGRRCTAGRTARERVRRVARGWGLQGSRWR